VPYDRPLTTMACFAMCDRCLAEYCDPRTGGSTRSRTLVQIAGRRWHWRRLRI
jgi:hypothetical protein